MTALRRRSRSRFRPIVTVLVVGVWVALMGWMLKDRYFSGTTELRDVIQFSTAETDDWFIIRIGGAYAGFGRSRQYRNGQDWILRDDLNIALNIQGQVKHLRIFSEAQVDGEFRLIAFRLKVSSGLISFEQKGRMEGRDLVMETPGPQGGPVRRMKLFEAPRMSRSLGLPLPLTGLESGQEIKIPIFDPMDGHKADAVVKVLERSDLTIAGKKVEAWRVRATFRAVELVMWIDNEGRLLKGRMPLGITVIRSDREEIADATRGARELPELVALTSVPVEGSIPEQVDLKSVRLQIQGRGDWVIPEDTYRQKVFESEVTITREKLPASTYTLPCTDPNLEQYLIASSFIRSDNKEVIAKATSIVGNEKDPVRAAQSINNWVHKYLRKVPTPSVPDAHTVLVRGEGDCNEHAVLAAALARAVGLPAQIVVGLVYSGDGFYYHAWVVYWAGKTWFTGDPVMNQMPVDPTHLTLLMGDVDKHVNVLTFLGRLKLKVLETQSEKES